MRFKLIFSIVGLMGIICGFSMIPSVLTDFFYGYTESAHRFAVSAGLCVATGLLIYLLSESEKSPLRIKEMFLTTTLVWLTFAILAAVPFYISTYHISWTNAVFEAMSGLTTTGATILTHLDTMAPGLLLWRSLLQWFGGVGIVIVALFILPALRIGGMQFFTTESSAQNERDLPTVVQNMRALMIYFVGMTIACAVCLKLAGMTTFDAVNHAFTTVSSGGFSTHDASIAYYQNPTLEWILIVFMILSGLPLMLGLYVIQRRWRLIRADAQIGFYLKFLAVATIVLTFVRWLSVHFLPIELMTYVRQSAFSVITVITTTGFVAYDYQLWGSFAVAFFMFLFLSGGCTGSTSGGIKMFRYTILVRACGVRLKHLVQPHGVFIPRYGNHAISDDVLISVLVFFGLYLGTAVMCTLALSVLNLDFITSFSGTLSALSNIGPALGHVIGPDKTCDTLPAAAKWLLSLAMLVGRLEFVSVFVLFFPFLWRKNA